MNTDRRKIENLRRETEKREWREHVEILRQMNAIRCPHGAENWYSCGFCQYD